MKKCILIQPGSFGDIFLCAPIAKWYADRDYRVDWPVTKKFLPLLAAFSYVNPIKISEESLHSDWLRSDVMKILPMIPNYDKVINLADRGPHPTSQLASENFEQCKYRLAEVAFSEKNKLSWERNINKEQKLFNFLGLSTKDQYALVHKEDSSGAVATVPPMSMKVVEVRPVENYSILDWFEVFKNASEIYCVESSIHQFLDGAIEHITDKRFLLKRPSITPNYRFTVSTNWDLRFIGENSIVRG
jgi:hypothetical protein